MKKIKDYIKGCKSGPINIVYKVYRKCRDVLHSIYFEFIGLLYYVFRIFPLQDKVVATTFRGRKYGDNPQFILEQLHKMNPDLDIVWLKNEQFDFTVPKYVRTISFYNLFAKAYEFATAKVWINTHRMEYNIKKRKGQLFIETWHGGLGIKKIEGDVQKVLDTRWEVKEINNTAKMADLFISNSDHLSKIYRRAFGYKGKIWKCGYPKNDIFFEDMSKCRKKVRECYRLDADSKLLVYAPTFRDNFDQYGFDKTPYSIDFEALYEQIKRCWGGKWNILLRWHPIMAMEMKNKMIIGGAIVDVTQYPDMQELILAADAFISDYSSCIFDAAMREIPCFTFATDFEEYKCDRGVYYEMNELPFPYAQNNDELIQNVKNFDYQEYLAKWRAFARQTGLHETGHASKDIAYVINEFINGNNKPLEDIKGEK